MTFLNFENSRDEGKPIRFFRFSFNSISWRYVASDNQETIGTDVYLPANIAFDTIRQSGDSTADALTIDAPSWIGPAQLFMSSAPSRNVAVSVLERHADSPQAAVIYSGEIQQVNFPRPGSCRIICETISASMRRQGLRLGWQRLCPYALYDPVTCRVNKALYARNLRVLQITNGNTLFCRMETPLAANVLNNGFIEWTHPYRGIEFLPIDIHSTTTDSLAASIVLFGTPGEIYPGAQAVAYPGCNNTPDACQSFNNYDNYGGHPDLPGKSPFDGDPVFY